MLLDADDIKKIVGLDEIINELQKKIDERLLNQPYRAECYECGAELDVRERKLDMDDDLIITVHPCECQKGEK